MMESEIRLLDGGTCFSKIIILSCLFNSKLFFPKAIVFMSCFSLINFTNDLMGKTKQENNGYWEKQLIVSKRTAQEELENIFRVQHKIVNFSNQSTFWQQSVVAEKCHTISKMMRVARRSMRMLWKLLTDNYLFIFLKRKKTHTKAHEKKT